MTNLYLNNFYILFLLNDVRTNMTYECLKEFEKLNTTTKSIYDLGNLKVLIILKDGTNLTSWDDVKYKSDIYMLAKIYLMKQIYQKNIAI